MKGSEIILKSLIEEGVDTIFGYPGGQIMPVYDSLYGYSKELRHILVRHEQGAVHAAQGYARAKGFPGVVVVTSGPGATNVITGVADAMVDSTPIVVIAGQVGNAALGTDAFQETDLIGLTAPITKWNIQVRRAEDIAPAVARAFYIAQSGRPGPVVIDLTKDAQIGEAEFEYKKCSFIRSYNPYPQVGEEVISQAVEMIDSSKRPFVVFGQGVITSGAEKELEAFINKGSIPAASTMLGLSALSYDNPHFKGMVGMHGNVAANVMTQECDLLIAVGMRFDDRVTGKVSAYARQARIIHIDIDNTEIGKNIPVDLGIVGDAKSVLANLADRISPADHSEWEVVAVMCNAIEKHKVVEPQVNPEDGVLRMGEVVTRVADAMKGKGIVVTDVGQNQMMGARYSRFVQSRSFISSGGLGTMGFGLPAAIGAKIAKPERPVCLFVGDGGLQMTMQEFGTIMQEGVAVKIVLLNNNWLGNVRQWQELFFGERYSFTRMMNPEYEKIVDAYGMGYGFVEKREDLGQAIEKMLEYDGPYLLNAHVKEEDNVFPMIPPGNEVDRMMLNAKEWFEYGE